MIKKFLEKFWNKNLTEENPGKPGNPEIKQTAETAEVEIPTESGAALVSKWRCQNQKDKEAQQAVCENELHDYYKRVEQKLNLFMATNTLPVTRFELRPEKGILMVFFTNATHRTLWPLVPLADRATSPRCHEPSALKEKLINIGWRYEKYPSSKEEMYFVLNLDESAP